MAVYVYVLDLNELFVLFPRDWSLRSSPTPPFAASHALQQRLSIYRQVQNPGIRVG